MHGDLYASLHHATAYLKSSAANEVWVQSFILILSAAIAILTLRSTSKAERRRATFDIVRDQQKDEQLIAARAAVRKLKNAPGGIDVAGILAKQDSPEEQAILTVLNSYEFVASGMENGGFDRGAYKKMYRNNVVRTWGWHREFVIAYRAREAAAEVGTGVDPSTYYGDFEALAERWARGPWWIAMWKRRARPAAKPAKGVTAAPVPSVIPVIAADAEARKTVEAAKHQDKTHHPK